MTRRLVSVMVAVLAMGLLAGCVAEGGGVPTPPATSARPTTPAPTPTVDPIDTVTAIVPRPDVVELRDAAGTVILELDYLDAAEPAVATIEQVIGSAPTVEDHPGNNHYPPTRTYRWGGVELREQRYIDRWADFADDERTLYRPGFTVSLTAPDSAGLTLTTEQGVAVGWTWVELAAMPELQVNPSGCSGPYLDYVVREEVWSDGTSHEQRFGVDFVASDDGSSVARVRAPMPIHEDGCA
ncbi:hypothetical protein [Agromyces lapidis]|uniref:Uncharacterized protein n=1 Tax=Agromyces lapidis TaxID=279574 RepID=A0ABV5SQS9_9MICO|nr:hypothetical protein [Agromyces lapidis]